MKLVMRVRIDIDLERRPMARQHVTLKIRRDIEHESVTTFVEAWVCQSAAQ